MAATSLHAIRLPSRSLHELDLSSSIFSGLGDIRDPAPCRPQRHPVLLQFLCGLWAFVPRDLTFNLYLTSLLGYFSQTLGFTFFLSDLQDGIRTPFYTHKVLVGILCPLTIVSWELSLSY